MAEYTPMVDIRRHQWHPETTNYITPVDKLPNPDWSCALAGVVWSKPPKPAWQPAPK